jgi:TPR repeat protein
MAKLRGLPILIFLVLAICSADARAEKRFALVIGNDNYVNVPKLAKAANDARTIGASLQAIGFTVMVGENLDQRTMSRRLVEFAAQLQPGDTAFFFFAGHGFEIAGRNYLLPVDVPLAAQGQEDLVRDVAFAADGIVDRVRARGARTTVLVLDACRDNPFEKPAGGTRGLSGGGGLAQMSAADGVFIMFSAGAKQEALDASSNTDADRNSVFTRFFSKNLLTPGATMLQIAKRTQTDVRQLALTVGREQMPAFYDQIVGDLILLPAGATPAPPAAQSQRPVSPVASAPRPAPPAPAQPAPAKPLSGAVVARLPDRSAAVPADAANECDRLAANPDDPGRPDDVSGLLGTKIDVVRAAAACNDAMRAQPNVPRFAYQAGRVAAAQKNFRRARELFERAANAGYPAAMTALALLYLHGAGVPVDDTQARQWLEKAAALNNPRAATLIGVLYLRGRGVTQDYAEARRWYDRAAAMGDALAVSNIGWLIERGFGTAANPADARRWYERAAQAGSIAGMMNLARCYMQGIGGPRDPAGAHRWHERAVDEGSTAGMVALGLEYARGEGVTQDFAQAREWYEKAAALGARRAMNNLGLFYENGRGMPRDPVAARAWYQKSADLGDLVAMRNLARVYDRGIGGPADPVQARQWLAKANGEALDEEVEQPAPARPVRAPGSPTRPGLPNR